MRLKTAKLKSEDVKYVDTAKKMFLNKINMVGKFTHPHAQ